MLSIQVNRTYKFSYVVMRNRRIIATFNSKKQAKDFIFELYNLYKRLSIETDSVNYSAQLLTGGSSMVVYTSTKRTLGYNKGEDFRDFFLIDRVKNY